MRTKTVLIVILGIALGAGVLWLMPQTLNAADKSSAQKILYYTCPMHPSVKEDKPGDCPICGMHLVPVYETAKDADTNNPATDTTNSPPKIPCCEAGKSN